MGDRLRLGQRVDALAARPDGTIAAGCSTMAGDHWDGAVVLASAPTLSPGASWKCPCGVPCVGFVGDGDIIALCAGRDDGHLSVLSAPAAGSGPGHAAPLDETALLLGHTSTISALAPVPGRGVATASWDGTVKAWDLAAASMTSSHQHHVGPVQAVGELGGLLVSGGDDGMVIAADARAGSSSASSRPAAAADVGSGITALTPAGKAGHTLAVATETGALAFVDLRRPDAVAAADLHLTAPAHALLDLGSAVAVGVDDGRLYTVCPSSRRVLDSAAACGGEYVRALAELEGGGGAGRARVVVGGWNREVSLAEVGEDGRLQCR